MYVCMHVRMYARMYVCMYVCMYVRMYVCVYVCMPVIQPIDESFCPFLVLVYAKSFYMCVRVCLVLVCVYAHNVLYWRVYVNGVLVCAYGCVRMLYWCVQISCIGRCLCVWDMHMCICVGYMYMCVCVCMHGITVIWQGKVETSV